jgi:NCS2 family nucleobase:cation symporter-2
MLLGNITPPLLIAGALGLAAGQTGILVQAVLLVAGLSTLVQAYPIGPVGGRIPIVMGTSIAFVGGSIAVGSRAGLAAVFGACLVAAVVEVVIGFSFSRVRRWFPPLVTSVVVMLIGLTLIPVGVDYAAGGVGAADYGSPLNLGIAFVVLLVTLVLNQYASGFLAYASVLAGVAVGYVLSLIFGAVDFSAVSSAAWLSVPRPVPFGMTFEWSAILIMAFIYVISSIETIGDITGVIAAAGREPTDRELKGGLVADGASSGLAALFGAFPTTSSYSQNVGLVNFTGVVSRHVTAVTGGLLILLGLVPKISAGLATIPPAVIGGAGLVMFSMIFASGAAIFRRSVPLTQRSLVILAIAVGLGLGVELRPEALQHLPEGVRNFIGTGLITGGLTALLLNAILPDPAPDD